MPGIARLVEQLTDPVPTFRFEAADALEKHSRTSPRDLDPYRKQLCTVIFETTQPGVQWHLAQVMPRLSLDETSAVKLAQLMDEWTTSSASSIVRSNALSCIWLLAQQYSSLTEQAESALARALASKFPAEVARARVLLRQAKPSKR